MRFSVCKTSADLQIRNRKVVVDYFVIITGFEITKVRTEETSILELARSTNQRIDDSAFDLPAVTYPTEDPRDAWLSQSLTS